MLIENLINDVTISKYICETCAENDVQLLVDASIKASNLLIIKVDDFYNSEVKRPDCSPDCLIIQRCKDHFDIYIAELKNVKCSHGIKVADIEEKFITCLGDFMSERFGNYFHDQNITINHLKLYLISDPYHFKKNPNRQLRMQGHKFDLLMAIRIPKFFGKHLYIEPKLPNPTVLLCA